MEENLLPQPVGDVVGQFGQLLPTVKGHLVLREFGRLGDDFSTSPDFFSSLLKEIVELERKRAEELRAERDRWAGIAESSQRQITHLTTKPPEPPAVISMPAPAEPEAQPVASERRGWWPFRRAG